MTPTEGIVFVSKITDNPGEFEVVGNTGRCKVEAVGNDVTCCKPGDYVLFSEYIEYDYLDQKIISVRADDIRGVDHA